MHVLPNTKILVFVTRHYHWLVKPLLYMYEKYFDVPVTFFSDRPIEGCDTIEVFPRDMHLYRESCWSLIKDALRKIDASIVSLVLIDELPIKPVDMNIFRAFATYMTENIHIARGNLSEAVEQGVRNCGELLYEFSDFSILKIPYTDQHIGQIGSTSLMPALWRRDFLLEFVEDDWTFDNIEGIGCRAFMQQNKWYSIATLPALFTMCHLCYTADMTSVKLSTIKNDEDRAFIEQYVPVWAKVK